MAKFNGHKNWNHWNVSLWINNDEGLYSEAKYQCSRHNKDEAAKIILDNLKTFGTFETPDGAPYSVTTIRAAMRGM